MTTPNQPLTIRENYLRAIEYRYPQWIPCQVGFAPIVWKTHREDLEKIVLDHPRIFPDYSISERDFFDEMPLVYRSGEYYRDNWGCVWYNTQEGLEGQVVGHPLEDWSALENYRMPDPLVSNERGDDPKDWQEIKTDLEKRKQEGKVAFGNAERLFDRLYFLRGFENLMFDFAEERLELDELIARLETYEMALVKKYLSLGVDLMGFHTDFGAQNGLMISPKSFRRYLKPLFFNLFQTCRRAGVHVLLSSDGRLLEVVDDLIECGVSVHDPQLRANGLEGIVKAYKGKLFAMLDLDRQGFPFMSPGEIRQQVREVVDAMAMPEGGLGVLAAVYGTDVSLANIAAICEAMEEFCFQ